MGLWGRDKIIPTTLVLQEVVLLEQLPVQQQALGAAGRVEHTGVLAQELLEHLHFRLTGLCSGEDINHQSSNALTEKYNVEMNTDLFLTHSMATSYKSYLITIPV